jgi:hypothetical protein
MGRLANSPEGAAVRNGMGGFFPDIVDYSTPKISIVNM